MRSIALAGHLCLDIAPQIDEHAQLLPGRLIEVGPLSVSLGGCVANTGRVLAALGADVTPFATIGADDLGEVLLSKLSAEGFAAPRMTLSPSASTSYSLVLERDGVDRTFWHHTGANDEFDGTHVEFEGAQILHVGYPTLLPATLTDQGRPLRELLERARTAGVTTSLDLAVVDPRSAISDLDWNVILHHALQHTDIASPSLDDLTSALRIDEPYSPELVDRLAQRMLDDGAAVVAISAGSHGLRLRTGSVARLREAGRSLAPLADVWADQAITAPPLRVARAVTTNGAGDASTAGLLFAISRGATPAQAATLAATCAAAVISGARPIPATVRAFSPSIANLFDGERP